MAHRPAPPELWGGVECTIVRIGETWRDQCEETGHRLRPGDVDLIAGLGIRTMRYPILWEAVAPERPDRLDFGWTDERLERLRERGIRVVAGLLHHGSGPHHTSLLDPEFPAKLADYAARVAERYPWIEAWTPVNEPLTTARFSGLYGHWYPHRRDYPSFMRALVNQCRGTIEAMAAIRAAIPAAQLIQTEDLGKTWATAPLRHQAAHDNQRRWLGLDLLCGRVGPRHPWHRILLDHGIAASELETFAGAAGQPDVIGINHYLTSERFLDHRRHLYPGAEIGGNGREAYVDAEAVRVRRLQPDTGLAPRLREAWRRYAIPLAVTEVHHGCTRDEQLRWFIEAWDTAVRMREEGIDLRAVTLWSLFGNVDWRSLLTRREQIYDAGVFDARGPTPRPTIVARAAAELAAGRSFDHPLLDAPGWWRRPPRLYPWHGRSRVQTRSRRWPGSGLDPGAFAGGGRRLLITGATGTLGYAFARICEDRGLSFRLTGRAELDLTDPASIARQLNSCRPWAVINTAGFVRVAEAEQERDACFAANADGAGELAGACAAAGIPLLTFSSDLVFDGSAGRPYDEADPVSPACVYGLSKAEAERQVLASGAAALVIRTSAFFGPWDRYNFAWDVLARLARGAPVRVCGRSQISPTFVPDLCHAALDLLIDGETGLWHLANQGQVSWYEFARRIAAGAGHDPGLVIRDDGPRDSATALTSRRGVLLRSFDAALADFLAQAGAEGERTSVAA